MRHIAFLRAINVGGRTVTMERLRARFEELGFEDVATYIASGNVIFEAPGGAAELERRIEAQLRESLGYEIGVFLRTPEELAAVAGHDPFPGWAPGKGETLAIAFLRAAPSREAAERVMACRTDTDDFHLHGRELYWRARAGLGRATVSGAALERALGAPTTVRNANTVRKLAQKYAA